MKKVNIKVQTIVWFIIMCFSLALLIFCSIIVNNANNILSLNKKIDVPLYLLAQANFEKSYSIGCIFLSVVLILISLYVSYAGIKSWKYSAIL